MGGLPNPLARNMDAFSEIAEPTLKPQRILTDRGIRQAMEQGLIKTRPRFDPDNDTKRVQPATLDMRLLEVDDTEPIGDRFRIDDSGNNQTFLGRHVSTVTLTELLEFGQFERTGEFMHSSMLNVSLEARSSVRRLGCYVANSGMFFSGPSHSQMEIGNFSSNSIHFDVGERVAQVFFTVDVFADLRWTWMATDREEPLEIGEKVRALDMGVECGYQHFRELVHQGYMKIKPDLIFSKEAILVHASDKAYRMRQIDGGIRFSDRKKYSKDDLLEPVDISRGYTVQPYEHIIIETIESFELSPHVGIRFWDNLPRVFCTKTAHWEDRKAVFEEFAANMGLIGLTDGWIDPGYNGGFSRQPKWLTGRRIYPGDVVGYGQVFFFPNGVGTSYGDASLGSQYKGKKETGFAK